MRTVHELGAWLAIALDGVAGLWGLGLALAGRSIGRAFWVMTGVAITATLAQVCVGVYLVAASGRQGGDQHVFYGIVVAFTLAFAYIYRNTMRRRPALAYGLLMLFVMGLALRGVSTFGVGF